MTKIAPAQKNKPASLGSILLDQLQQSGARPVQLLKNDMALSAAFESAIRDLLEQLEAEAEGPVVLTALSNAVQDLNPFSGLQAAWDNTPDQELPEQLVSLLGPGRIHQWHRWPDHFTIFSIKAVEVLAHPETTTQNALLRLGEAGGKLLLSDSLFLHDPATDLFRQEALDPHEQRRPTAWGSLSERLDDWLRLAQFEEGSEGNQDLEDFCSASMPVTLHITHSWSGGVAQWIESFIDADQGGVNLQLRSEGPESGSGCGQRFSLYLANRLETPVASWWLQPPIHSTADENSLYRKILQDISTRYGVGRIVVSSLIGHSLDALATSLPTIQVLHDYYPRWPLLGIHPGPYLQQARAASLARAFEENTLLPEFGDRDASGWETLGERWRESIVNWGVRVAAPSRSVANLLRQLDPAWSEIDIEIIPHGLPELPGRAKVLPRDREDGRLRLVIPGRIQEGKGQSLLLEALPELTRYAQIYLLGAGKSGERFFGKSGVDVIVQYDRAELRDLLAGIGPHAAGLLSIVPETFSYTLSEMQQLDIPVIATRVGSLEERVSHGESGWLIEPDAPSLVKCIRQLAADREQISGVRKRLQEFDLPGAARMVEQYDKICMPRPARRTISRSAGSAAAQADAMAFQKRELATLARQLKQKSRELQAEVEERTAWAEEREQARKKEKKRRKRWVSKLESYLEERSRELKQALDTLEGTLHALESTTQELTDTRHALESSRESLKHSQGMLQQTSSELDQLRATHDWVLGSWSWRATRPLRIIGRALSNAARVQAWNPLKWPLLFSQAVRIIKTRGLRGAFLRAQFTQRPVQAKSVDSIEVEAIGESTAPESFLQPAEPEVSLLIPVYNKWEFTAACLRSLAETQCRTRFEVIVVDDQSSDETPRHLASIDGLVYVCNEENLGFVGSCNRGAEEARGEFILLLNNDTQVLDGWLDALVDTFKRHPNTGLAGARLIYPDGRLQEAGGIVFRDGSGWNYGKGANADRPEYLYSREVDYCSGACIMLRTELFRQLDGFDSRYAPAYYEDVDLAFRVRASGFEVRVQPDSTIVHHEGATSGTDLNSGVKRHQAVNQEKFLDRWREDLASHAAPIIDPTDESEIRRARDHHLKGRVLIIDAYTPEPDQDAGSLRLRFIMGCFRDLGYGVTFLADNHAYAGAYTTDLQKAGVEVVYDPWVESLPRFFDERGGEFDIVMISRYYVASKYLSLMKRYCPQARFILDTVDLHYLREERLAQLKNSRALKQTAAQTRRSELAVINAADATLVVSPVEQTLLHEAAPDARIHVISIINEVLGSSKPFKDRKDIFFVGGYQHPPNIDAAVWFTQSIWPLIRKELPEIEFHLIGSKATEEVRALHGNGVHFHGFVETLDPWLDGCRMAIAPLRYGAGIKGKVNMSMSRGQPVVATPIAVEGMFAKSGREVLVAESAEEFAEAVIRLYRDEDLWNRISVGGLENIRQYFSVETARLGLQQLIRSFD